MADQPTCATTGSGPYCSYTGKVKSIYINSANLILISFDTGSVTTAAAQVGITVSNGDAAAFLVSDNADFAHLFYSTALSAQATGRPITIQMRGTVSGYMKLDRIWLAQP